MWHFSRWKADVIFISADKKEEKKQNKNKTQFQRTRFPPIGMAPLVWHLQ